MADIITLHPPQNSEIQRTSGNHLTTNDCVVIGKCILEHLNTLHRANALDTTTYNQAVHLLGHLTGPEPLAS